jgi:hypothetical protein
MWFIAAGYLAGFGAGYACAILLRKERRRRDRAWRGDNVVGFEEAKRRLYGDMDL